MTASKQLTPGYYFQLLKQMSPEEQTEDFCMQIVQTSPSLLGYMACPTHSVCLAAVTKNGYLLDLVQQQTPELCEAAVTQECGALQFVHEQTPELCFLAVQQSGLVLQHVKEGLRTVELCVAAVKNNGQALEFVDMPFNSIADPASSQLMNWNRILEACENTDNDGIICVLHPLIETLPLGRQVQDEWQQKAPDGRLMLDHLVVLAEHIKRLAPEDHKVKPFLHKVNEQVAGVLAAAEATDAVKPANTSRYHNSIEAEL